MARKQGYGQYCPIAVAAEIVAERWTPLVIRALCMGATRYGEIRESVPRMSTALLSRRLRELEHAGLLSREKPAGGHGYNYRLTRAGQELFPVLEAMGFWSQKWLQREITQDRNLDPDILMWELRRAARNVGPNDTPGRRVAQFRLSGVPPGKQRYWLVFESGDADICTRDPGFEVDIWISAHIRTLVKTWLGHKRLGAVIDAGDIRLDGSSKECAAFSDWFECSHFSGPHSGV